MLAATPFPKTTEGDPVTQPDTEKRLHINHLIHETSPYLLQHAHNPVDWYPWGEEALQKARTEDKPIFLSIGYSACHWCHVMEHESFENEDIAAILRENFVSIKVDREERPDIDEIYMAAVVGLTGSGGWPMSVWLTPDLKPFYGGTYYPPVDRFGRAGFPRVLQSIADAWKNRREEVLNSADGLTQYLQAQLTAAPQRDTEDQPGKDNIEKAIANLRANFDTTDGGWGGAPKFPSSASILLLLRAAHRSGDPERLHMAEKTLEAMAYGGIYDQLGGGFHRYSVDAEWLVPHFEKMLYDNAQLAVAYIEAYQLTKKPLYARIARETLDYVLRDMHDERGGFHSAEDADSEGEEGKFYIWTHAQIEEALGKEDAALFCAYYNVQASGNFTSHEPYHHQQNILHLTQPPADIAQSLGLTEEALEARLAPMRATLVALRAKRTRPGLDDKVLTSWNGLMISAFARGARVLGHARYTEAAEAAANFLLQHMKRGDVLLRTHRKGESRLDAYLDDYAFTANALVDLYETTFDPKWLHEAEALAARMLNRFWSEESGLFYFSSEDHKHLLVRTQPTYDGAEPSGNAIAALALQRIALHHEKPHYNQVTRKILGAMKPQLEKAPQAFLRMLLALDFALHPPREIAIIGPRAEAQPLLDIVSHTFVPNLAIAYAETPSADTPLPLLRDKKAIGGKATAYLCQNYACDAPLTTPDALREKLRR